MCLNLVEVSGEKEGGTGELTSGGKRVERKTVKMSTEEEEEEDVETLKAENQRMKEELEAIKDKAKEIAETYERTIDLLKKEFTMILSFVVTTSITFFMWFPDILYYSAGGTCISCNNRIK